MNNPWSIIVISNPDKVANEVGVINALFEQGLETLHLRKPGYSKSAVEDLIKAVEPRFRQRIVLHQHYTLAIEYQLRGIHFTGQFIRNGFTELDNCYQEAKRYAMTVSSSKHRLEELQSLEIAYDYVFLSPIFDSISKEGYRSNFVDLENVSSYKKNSQLVALGGVALDKLAKVKQMGFDGAAVLGAIWQTPEKAIEVFKELKAIWEKKDHLF